MSRTRNKETIIQSLLKKNMAARASDDLRAACFGIKNRAPVALAEGKVLLRDQSRMLCVKVVQ